MAEDQDRGVVVNASDMPDDFMAVKKKKKTKKKKPASKRGLGKPTGFEQYHADGPLTPEQFAESREAFNPDFPFVERVLKAIQRFERTRKLSPERRDVFYKYLAYGGVDVGPNMFVGAQDTEDMDKDQMTAAMAQANISDETKKSIVDPKHTQETQSNGGDVLGSKLHSPEHMAKYVVDFEATMRGFLSRHATMLYAFDTEESVGLVTTTLERFMDYLLQHDVCPEFSTEILNTRNLCRAARTELWHCIEAQRHLPGEFNIACSTLFGGNYGQHYDGETNWGPTETGEPIFVGLKPEMATQIVGFAIAGAANEEVYIEYDKTLNGELGENGFEVIKIIQDHGFEILRIEEPSQECVDFYKENTTEFKAVGRVYAKFFANPDAPPEDLTADERAAMLANGQNRLSTPHDDDEYIFFVESDPLFQCLQPGMRIQATIRKLNCDVWFFDEIVRVLPSFDIWLENELMLGWKEPRPTEGAPACGWNVGRTRTQEKDDDNNDQKQQQQCLKLEEDSSYKKSTLVEPNAHLINSNSPETLEDVTTQQSQDGAQTRVMDADADPMPTQRSDRLSIENSDEDGDGDEPPY